MDSNLFAENGNYLMLALDHRDGFKKIINPIDPNAISHEQVVNDIQKILQNVHSDFSGMVLDTDYSLPAYKSLEIQKPYLLPIENMSFSLTEEGRFDSLTNSAQDIKNLGASGIKLMIQFNPDLKSAEHQVQIANTTITEAHDRGIPVFLGLITYDMEDSEKILRSVEYLLENSVTPDVFILEFPGSDYMCQRVTRILGVTPWIILTGGDDYVLFREQLMMACENGCRGFLAGRSLWQEYFETKDISKKEDFLINTLSLRFKEMKKIVESL